MIGGFVVEGALIGAAGCAVWEAGVRAYRWYRDRRRLGRLSTYLHDASDQLRGVAMQLWTADDPSMRTVSHHLLELTAELEVTALRSAQAFWRPRREYTQQLSNLLAISRLVRRLSHDPRLTSTAEATALGALSDSLRLTIIVGHPVAPRLTPAPPPQPTNHPNPAPAPQAVPRAPADPTRAATGGLAPAHYAAGPSQEAATHTYTGKHRGRHDPSPYRNYTGKHRDVG